MYPSAILAVDREQFADPHDVGQLEEPLRSRIFTVIHDAPTFGLVLVSGRRSPWQQYLLRVGRVGASHAFDSRYPGYPRTALPYRSQHQRGLAADMGGRDLPWLIKNKVRYGLGQTVSSENWHFEAVGNPVYRILPYPGSGDEEFTMDAEAKAAFAAVEQQNSQQLAWMMRMEARIEELEKNRWEPTTHRTRLLAEHFGVTG